MKIMIPMRIHLNDVFINLTILILNPKCRFYVEPEIVLSICFAFTKYRTLISTS